MKDDEATRRAAAFLESSGATYDGGYGPGSSSDRSLLGYVTACRQGMVVTPPETVRGMALAAGASRELADTMTTLAVTVAEHPMPMQRSVASQRALRLQVAEAAPRSEGRWFLSGESDLLISSSMIEAKYRQRGLDTIDISIIQRISAERYEALVDNVRSGTPTKLIVDSDVLESALLGTPRDVNTYFDRLEGLIEAGAQVRLMESGALRQGVIYGEQAELVLDGSLGPQFVKTFGRQRAGSSVPHRPTERVSLSDAWSAGFPNDESLALLREARPLAVKRARIGQMLKRGEIPAESRKLLEALAQYRGERDSMDPKDWSPRHRALSRAAEMDGFRLRQLLCAASGNRLTIGEMWTIDRVAERVEIPPAVRQHLESLQREGPHDRYTETGREPAAVSAQIFYDLLADATELTMHVRSTIPAALLPPSDVADLAVRPAEIAELDANHAQRLADPKYSQPKRVRARSRRMLPSEEARYKRERARLVRTRELTATQFTEAMNGLLERGGRVTVSVDESTLNRVPEARRERLLAYWSQLGEKGARFAVGRGEEIDGETTAVAKRSTGLPVVMQISGNFVQPGEANELQVLLARHDTETALQKALKGVQERSERDATDTDDREYETVESRRVPVRNEVPPPSERRRNHAEALLERPPAKIYRRPDRPTGGGRPLPDLNL